MNKTPLCATLTLLCLAAAGKAEEVDASQAVPELVTLQSRHPEASFTARFDTAAGDWKIAVRTGGQTGERISRFGSTEHRSAAPVPSTALFDILYDSATRGDMHFEYRPELIAGRTLPQTVEELQPPGPQ